jgi:hypothetical protein
MPRSHSRIGWWKEALCWRVPLPGNFPGNTLAVAKEKPLLGEKTDFGSSVLKAGVSKTRCLGLCGMLDNSPVPGRHGIHVKSGRDSDTTKTAFPG